MLAQVSPEIAYGAWVAGILFIIKSVMDIWAQKSEIKDRKIVREQIVVQTEVLKNIHIEQIEIRKISEDMSKSMNIAIERQLTKDQAKSICRLLQNQQPSI